MEFETAKSAAERLGVGVRTVQKWAAVGKLNGAVKSGRDWLIPTDALPQNFEKPTDRIAFLPFAAAYCGKGDALDFINQIENEDEKRIALGEYYYHKGENEKAVEILEEYLDSDILDYRFAATHVCIFAYLACNHKHKAQLAMHSIDGQLRNIYNIDADNTTAAKGVFVSSMLSTLLHFSDDRIPPIEDYIEQLDSGNRAIALYTAAYQAYLKKDYGRAHGIAEATLLICYKKYTIAFIYLHIIAAVSLINLSKTEEAKQHIKKAWEYAEKDGFYEPFAEHHAVLQGLLENYIKKHHPEEFKKIIEIAKTYGKGWRAVHNELMQKTVADNLTTTEFVIAMLFYRNWRIKEIAVHMDLSERTIKNYLQIIYQKLGINGKKGLEKFMIE